MDDVGGTPEPTDLLNQWLAHRDGRPAGSADDAPAPVPAAEVVGSAALPEPVAVAGPELAAPATAPVRDRVRSLPQTIFFKPRGGTQRVLGLLLLAFLVVTAGAAWWAWQDRSYTSYAIVGVIAVVTGIIWAARTSAAPARLTLHGSELEIVRNGSKALFDLAHTQVEVKGTPGRRGWKVLLRRRSMSPYVIDSSMVDPREFTLVVRFFHPEA